MSDWDYSAPRAGWIEVVCGCMFSGKTEELIRQIRRAAYARQSFKVFKPQIDNRYSEEEVSSHRQDKLPAIVINNPREILENIESQTKVVGIDEGQFFSDELIEVATELAHKGVRVIIAGLDTDWKGRPFGPMPQLMSIAEIVKKQSAICMECGRPATRTQRIGSSEADILVGSTDSYEARCRAHFVPRPIHQTQSTQNKAQPVEERSPL
jgi:thymidine kinase